jgi:hypothetical protein
MGWGWGGLRREKKGGIFSGYPKLAITKHFTLNKAEIMIEAQTLI